MLTQCLSLSPQEPLALASGALPDWCEQLTSKCPFLIPFETRQLYFTCTAFGASRYGPTRLRGPWGGGGGGVCPEGLMCVCPEGLLCVCPEGLLCVCPEGLMCVCPEGLCVSTRTDVLV